MQTKLFFKQGRLMLLVVVTAFSSLFSSIYCRGGDAFINVQNFGAVGDGSHDDYQHIRSAIDSLEDGGTVCFPPGNYLISSPIVFGSANRSIILSGSSTSFPYMEIPKGSVITPSVTFPVNRGVFEFSGTGSVSNDRAGAVVIKDITVAGTSSLTNAILLKSARNVYFERCHLTASQPILFTPTLTFIDFVRFTDCFVQASGGAGEAVCIKYTTSGNLAVTNVIFDGGWLLGGKIGGSCVYADNVEGLEFRGTYFDSGSVTRPCVYITSSSALCASRPVMFFNVLAEFVGTFLQVDGVGPNQVGIEGLRTLPSTATAYPLITIGGTGPHRVSMKNTRLGSVCAGDPIVNITNPNARFYPESPYMLEASVYTSNAIPISHGGSGTNVTFNSEEYDLYATHSASQPTRITIPWIGKYRISYSVQWAANTNGIRITRIKKNGVDMSKSENIAAGVARSTTASFEANFNKGDNLELSAYQDSGSSLNLNASLSISYIGE